MSLDVLSLKRYASRDFPYREILATEITALMLEHLRNYFRIPVTMYEGDYFAMETDGRFRVVQGDTFKLVYEPINNQEQSTESRRWVVEFLVKGVMAPYKVSYEAPAKHNTRQEVIQHFLDFRGASQVISANQI